MRYVVSTNSRKFIVEGAILANGATQEGIAAIAERLPQGVVGSTVILIDFGMHLMACDDLRASKLTHHHRVAAVGPPIEGMINCIYPSIVTKSSTNRKSQGSHHQNVR